MREIKFRAWIPQAKEWINDVDLKDLWSSGRALEEHGTSRYEAENSQGVRWTFDDLIFVQFTGLKDKAGRQIYEGDILEAKEYWGEQDYATVVWSEEELQWYLGFHNTFREPLRTPFADGSFVFEIIGNIYQNPGLIHDPTP